MEHGSGSVQGGASALPGDLPVLRGLGLVLRRVLPSDAGALREISYYDGVAAETAEQAVRMLARIDEDMARGHSLHWGICLQGSEQGSEQVDEQVDERGSDEIVGTCGFYRGLHGGVGEVGYVLREAYRGRGVMTAAVRLVAAFGFGTLNLDSIVAYTDADNEPSMAVLGRVGFAAVEAPAEGRDPADRKFVLTAAGFAAGFEQGEALPSTGRGLDGQAGGRVRRPG